MAKFKIHKTKDYTIMSNTHLKEKEMSLKAKGLLSVMFSLSDNWNYSIDGLVSICKENETAIKSTLDELKTFGYLTVTKLMPNETKSGRIEYVYDIYEIPKQEGEKQGIENLPLEFLPLENQPQLNTNILSNKPIKNNKSTNTKELKKETIKEFPEVVLRIFNHWKSKGIYPREDLTEKKAKAIQKALKSYSEEEITSSIDRYSSVIFDKSFYFNTEWYIDTFMTQGNCLPNFTENGERWLQYCAYLNEPKKSAKTYGANGIAIKPDSELSEGDRAFSEWWDKNVEGKNG